MLRTADRAPRKDAKVPSAALWGMTAGVNMLPWTCGRQLPLTTYRPPVSASARARGGNQEGSGDQVWQ